MKPVYIHKRQSGNYSLNSKPNTNPVFVIAGMASSPIDLMNKVHLLCKSYNVGIFLIRKETRTNGRLNQLLCELNNSNNYSYVMAKNDYIHHVKSNQLNLEL